MTLPLSRIGQLQEQLYTAQEFMTLPLDKSKRYELVRGVIKEMSHPGEEHTLIGGNLFTALAIFVQSRRSGRVLPPGGFELKIPGATRDTVRSPDLTFLAEAKVSWQPGAIKALPDLAVEIYSPNDRPGDLSEKLQDYQQAGWNLVWVIYPPSATPRKKAGTVDIYRLQEETRLQPATSLDQTATLVGEGILEGFTLPVKALFE